METERVRRARGGGGDGEIEKQRARRERVVKSYTNREGRRWRETNDCEKKKRVSLRKQTLKQRCMTCTFSPLDNPEVVVGEGWGGGQTDRQTVRESLRKERTNGKRGMREMKRSREGKHSKTTAEWEKQAT